MRVHELAKEYGIKSTEFVDIIQEFGVDIKSHLSSLDDTQVATIRNQMSIKDQVKAAQDYTLEKRFNQEELPTEVKEWVNESDNLTPRVEPVGVCVDNSKGKPKKPQGAPGVTLEGLHSVNQSKVDLHESEKLEEIVEEVVESLTQEVVVEPPRGFLGWVRNLFS